MSLDQNKYSKTVFVDTSAIVGFAHEKDSNREKALEIFSFLIEKEYYLFISNYIVAEVHALTLSRNKLKDTLERIQSALDTLKWLYDDFAVLFVDQDLEKKAREELLKYNDKPWSIADMTSFLLIQEHKIAHFFSFDNHFNQAGSCFGFSDVGLSLSR